MTLSKAKIQRMYRIAREQYASLGVDTEKALSTLEKIPISLHCWQGDDVTGFADPEAELSGGLAATGNYLKKCGKKPSHAAISA